MIYRNIFFLFAERRPTYFVGCQYVDHCIVILSHDRDSNFGLHETALFRFSRLWTKAEERLSEKAERKQQERTISPL